MAESILSILQHSLGVDQFGRGRQYRNHYVTGPGCDTYALCMEAVERRLMTRLSSSPLTGGDDCFHVTPQGRAFVAEHSPRPGRKQKARDRYSRYLDLSDVIPDLTFRDFLRREKEFARG